MELRMELVVASGLAMSIAGGAFGAFSVTWDPMHVEPLDLGADGEWTEGEEWWVTTANLIVLQEAWVGAYGSSVMLGAEVTKGTSPPALRAPTAIALDKNVVNNSGFVWTSFQVDILAGAGATISNVMATSTTQFADVTITANGGGSFTILWTLNGGTGVGLGDTADLLFSFNIDGVLSFSQVQTPIPAPGGAALLALAGAGAVRRRRR